MPERQQAAGWNTHEVPAVDGEWLLAIDTATDQAGVALFDGARLHERSWPGGRQQTATVSPAIDALLAAAGIGLTEIGAVAVANGPGSFTGLRVGLSIAKGMAAVAARAVVGIGTLEIVAAPWLAAGRSCIALIPAGRGRVVWAAFSTSESASDPVNMAFDDFLDALARYPGWLVAGELTEVQRDQIFELHGPPLPASLAYRRPGLLAELGYRRWRQGDVDEPVLLEPVYLHGQPNPR